MFGLSAAYILSCKTKRLKENSKSLLKRIKNRKFLFEARNFGRVNYICCGSGDKNEVPKGGFSVGFPPGELNWNGGASARK
jgi:hypothetical protein